MRMEASITVLTNGAVALAAAVSGMSLLVLYVSHGEQVHLYAGVGFCILAAVNVLAAIAHHHGGEPEINLWRATLMLACAGITSIIAGVCSTVMAPRFCGGIRALLLSLTALFCMFLWRRPKFKNVSLFLGIMIVCGLAMLAWLFARSGAPGVPAIGAGSLTILIGLALHRKDISFHRLNRNDILHVFLLAGILCLYRGIYLLEDLG